MFLYRIVLAAGSKRFFFEKKHQKTFADLVCIAGRSALQLEKVFAAFFQKNSVCLSSRGTIRWILGTIGTVRQGTASVPPHRGRRAANKKRRGRSDPGAAS